MTDRTRVSVDAKTPRPCPAWCEQKHDRECYGRLHMRTVHEWSTAPGETANLAVVRYDRPDGTSAPAMVRMLTRGNDGVPPVKFTPAEARKTASIFSLCATQREGLNETAQIGRAFTVAADLIDPE